MNIICPKCGKDDVTFFSDSVFKTVGIHCVSCNCDFAVDLQDKSLIKHYIDSFTSFSLLNMKDKENYESYLLKENKLYIFVLKENKVITDLQIILHDEYDAFISLLFYKLYILDFPDSNSVSDQDNDFIKIKLVFNNMDNIVYRYHDYKPVYLPVLEKILSPFLEIKHE